MYAGYSEHWDEMEKKKKKKITALNRMKTRTPSVSQSWFICTDTQQPDCENKACVASHWHQQISNVWATLHIGGNAEVEVPTLLRRPTRRHAGEDLDERDVRFQQQIPSESSFSSSFWCFFFLLRWWEGVRPWLLLLSHGSARKGNLTDTDWAERGERKRGNADRCGGNPKAGPLPRRWLTSF